MSQKYYVCHRRGTAEQWASANIKPLAGEIVVEIDNVNNLHKLKIGDGEHSYADLAYLMAGDDIVSQVLPRTVTVTLEVEKWAEVTSQTNPNIGHYSQEVVVDGITAHSRVDLQPDADMIAEFRQLNLVFTTENKGGVITVYSVGDMPLKTYTMQATIIETQVLIDSDKIVGIPIGAPKKIIERADLSDEINELLDRPGGGGGIVTETDPTVPSHVKEITTDDISNWNAKSDFSGSYDDLANKPTIPVVPANVSAFENDSGYLTSYTETDPTVPSWAKAETKPAYSYNEITNKPTFATVATSGNYADLAGVPSAATSTTDGLMSATDKENLDVLVDSFSNDDSNTTIDTVKEVLKAFENAPEGTNIANALASKVDANEAIQGATKTKITYDSKGLVTSGGDLTASDIPNIDASKITSGTFADARIASATTWNAKQDAISDLSTIRSGATAGASAVQPGDLAAVATSGSYNDLSNKPTIPTVNNGTLTIQKNGTDVGTFTANQSGDSTANIVVPTKTSELNNDSGFLTSIPQATEDTLGGVKVGESMQIDENGVIDTKPLSYVYSSTVDTTVRNIDENGIQCDIVEIEVETQTEDGSVHYEYARDNEIGIPIVAGKGITITKNDNNRAEISTSLNKDGINGYIDTYFNDVVVSENGIYTYGNIEITDGDDNLVDTIDSNVTLPIVAGEGISITKNSNNKAEIGVDDIPTSKLFKDVNEIEIGHIDINNLYYSNAGIVYFSDVSFMDDNGGDLAKTTAYHRLPIVAGEGISIAENSDRTKAVISAKGLATESYVDTKVANLVNSAPETLNTLGELATAIQNHEDEYDALLETVGNKANKSDLDNYLPKSGGTIDAGATISMGGTGSNSANLKWTTISGRTPYIGYCTQSGDGTFMITSIEGTTYPTGLAIGGSSKNLLWKGAKVATTSDIPTVNNGTLTIQKNGTNVATFSANQSGNATANILVPTAGNGLSLSENTLNNSAPLYFVPNLSIEEAGSSTSGARLATKWAVSGVDGITTPTNGMAISIRTPNDGISGGVLLSIDNGTTYYPIVRNANSMITTHYGLGTTVILIFNDTQTASVYATSETLTNFTGCWQVADFDSNTKTTAGTSNKTGAQMYLVGGTSQSSSGVTTYSNKNVYIGADNSLYSYNSTAAASEKVATTSDIPIRTSQLINDNDFIESNPAKDGNVKTSYRIAKQGYTNGENWYYKLCTLPANNSQNFASVIISGRIGGWESGNMSYINALVWNRGTPGISVIDIAGNATAASNIWSIGDLALYVESDGSASLYILCKNYFTFDLNVEVYQSTASITYDGSYITAPTGTATALASQASNRLELYNNSAAIGGSSVLTSASFNYDSTTKTLTIS